MGTSLCCSYTCLVSKHLFFKKKSARRSKVDPFLKSAPESGRKTDRLQGRLFRSDHLVGTGLII